MSNVAQGVIASSVNRVVVGLGATGLSCARYFYRRGEAFSVIDTRAEAPGLADFRKEMPDVPVYAGVYPVELVTGASELVVGYDPALMLRRGALWRNDGTGLLRLECVGTILLHARGRWLLATGARRRAGIIAWRLGWSSLPMGRAMGAALRGGLAWGRAPERARGWMVEASEGFMACGMRTHAAACRHRALALAPGTEPAVEWPDGLESERVADALAPVAR